MRTKKYVFYSMIVLSVFLMQGCSKKKNLESLSPRQVVELFHKASNECDTELLRQIMYFPPGTSEAEISKRVGPSSLSTDAKGAARMMDAMKMKIAVKYEKILNEDTAEVGVVAKIGVGPLSKRIPGDQIVMKRENGIWKVHYSRGELTREDLVGVIRENPQTAWAYYCLGMKIQSENPYRAYKYYQKYYELEPKGFWADRYRDVIEDYGNTPKMEQILFENIKKAPENSQSRVSSYMRLGQLFTANKDFKKAQMYLDKAEDMLRENFPNNRNLSERLEKAWQELELKESGEYTDILTELDK